MSCKALNICLLGAAPTLGLRGPPWAACWRVAGRTPCSPLCTTVIPPLKYPPSSGCSTGAAHGQLIQPALADSSAGLNAEHAQQRHGFSKRSAPEPLRFSPSAIESQASAYLISPSFSETYLCWDMAFTSGLCLIWFVLLWERLAQSCVALRCFSAVLVAMP